MKKRIISVLVSIILIVSIICCASVPGSAVFVVDDVLLYSIGISVAASIALSCGIAVASGQDNAFSTGANALGQMVYESLQEQYSQAQLLSMIVIANGKAYFKSPESLYTRIKNYLQNYNFSSLTVSNHLTSGSFETVPNTSLLYLSDISNKFAIGSVSQTVSYQAPTYTFSYIPNSGIFLTLNDGTMFKRTNVSIPSGLQSLCTMCVDRNYLFSLRAAYKYSGNSYTPEAPNKCNVVTTTISSLSLWSSCTYNGVTAPLTYVFDRSEWLNHILFNGVLIAKCSDYNDYVSKCISSGTLLVNVPNNYGVVNSNSDLTTISQPVDISKSAPSIPDSEIGQDSSIMIPLPGNLVDPSNPDIPLTQTSVKNRIKRGQAVEFVPEIEKLNGVLPRDYPVLVTNTVSDTQVIDTPLSTTYIGDNSETFLVIPNNPGTVVIPGVDDEPIVNYPYPDVINPGNETITIVNNPDVFPTRVPAETATAAPGETVGEITRVSEIVSEAVSDIVQPVTPEDIERGANKMRLSELLIRKFPFCIPFDFYNAINQFAAPSEVPVFDIPFELESLNIHYNFHIDLTQFETAAKISRWFFSVSWVVVLIFLTRKVIWK